MDVLKQFSENIKRLRIKNNMTIQELSRITCINEKYLIKIEKCEAKRLQLHHLDIFCKCFNVETKEILN